MGITKVVVAAADISVVVVVIGCRVVLGGLVMLRC
jgi:hypothetical protein